MTSVVATGKSDAWVAGLACGPGCPGSRSLVVRRWNGGKWLTVAPPKGLTSAKNLLNGALHGTGKHWPVAKFPRFSQITGTEVFSAKNAWAFGISGSAGQPYDARWTGSAWHTVALPHVSKPAGDFVVPGTIVALGPKNVWESYGLGNAGTCCLSGGK